MAIKNEKEFLAKQGFRTREAYNKKQKAIYKEKTNLFVKSFKIFLLTFSFSKNLLLSIIGFLAIAFVTLLATLWGASLLYELFSIPLTNKYGYWQIYGIFLDEDFIESGIFRFFLFLLYLFIQLCLVVWAWTIFTNGWWYFLGFDKEEKKEDG